MADEMTQIFLKSATKGKTKQIDKKNAFMEMMKLVKDNFSTFCTFYPFFAYLVHFSQYFYDCSLLSSLEMGTSFRCALLVNTSNGVERKH